LGRVLGFRRRTLICEENDCGMGRTLQFILDIANPGGLKGLGSGILPKPCGGEIRA
jgi:hypothetical protein